MRLTSTNAYRDRWARWALLAPVLALVPFVLSSATEREVWSQTFLLGEDQEVVIPDLRLPATSIGALRIEANAVLPRNRWAAYQVSLLDESDEPLLELVKDAWSETGVWREDGESGTWAESDTELLWDLRARAAETVKLEVSVLETGLSYDEAAGGTPPGYETEADGRFAVPLGVKVLSGVVDGRFLVMGLLFALAFALLAYYQAGHGGRPVIVETTDGDLKGRAVLGGEGRLISVAFSGLVDETAPPEMKVRVSLRDDAGKTIYERVHTAAVRFRKDEGEIEDGRVSLRLYLELPRRIDCGVLVQTTPDAPIEHVKLVVRDGASTRGTVAVERVSMGTGA